MPAAGRRGDPVRHIIRGIGWILAGALLGMAVNAYGQDTPGLVAEGDADLALVLRIANTFGLPGVAAAIAYWLRGLLANGITVRLHEDDRELLRRDREPRTRS